MNNILPKDFLCNDLQYIRPLFEHVKNSIALTDTNAKILYINPAFSDLTGYTKDEATGDNPGILHSGYHSSKFYKLMWEEILKSGFWEGEVWNRKKSGEIYPALLTITALKNNHDETTHYLAISSDITFLKKENTEKINLAFYDPLTGLSNRLALEETFQKLAGNMQRSTDSSILSTSNNKIALIFFDLNKFKNVNDEHGHVVGDKLLKIIASRLQHITKNEDIISRFGGDEFVAIIKDITSKEQIDHYCKRIHSIFESPFKIDDLLINSSTSIGASIYPDESKSFEGLLKQADKAMYHAKRNQIPTHYYFPDF